MAHRLVQSEDLATVKNGELVMLRKYAELEKMDGDSATDASRQFRFIFSTGSSDRDNDMIFQDGWDLADFRKNPVALWAHSHRDLPVGRAVSVGIEGGNLVGVIEFATHPFAETVYQLVKGGFLKAVSVGFQPLEYSINEERHGIDFKRQSLLEISIVPVPANAQALMAASASGVDLEPMRKWMQDLICDWPGELKLKGSAWEKLRLAETPVASKKVKVGDLEVEIKVGSEDAVKHIEAVSAALDALSAKADAVQAKLAKLGKDADAEAAPATDPDAEPTPAEVPPVVDPVVEPAASGATAEAEAADELGEPVLELADEGDEEVVLELADDSAEDQVAAGFDLTAVELRECMSEMVGTVIAELAATATRSAINQLRGRLD